MDFQMARIFCYNLYSRGQRSDLTFFDVDYIFIYYLFIYLFITEKDI